MKTFEAEYYQGFNYGAYIEYKYVIAANNANEALGLALESQSDTLAKYWTITEIDLTKPIAIMIDTNEYP